jgi:hypothetical protein
MAQELSDLDEIDATFIYTKPDGGAGTIDTKTTPTISSADESVATGTITADGLTATIRSGDNLRADTDVRLIAHVDVDLGDGVQTLDIPIDMIIKSHTAGQVSTANVSFGSPRRKS